MVTLGIGSQEEYDLRRALSDLRKREEKMNAPSFMLKPKLFLHKGTWCALLGDDLKTGVAGFGQSPDLAYQDFDKNWFATLT